MKSTDNHAFIQALQTAWRKEQASQRIYRDLSEKEPNPARKNVLLKLAKAEEEHSRLWTQRLTELGAAPGTYRETLREAAWRWILVQTGTDNALKQIEKAEDSHTDDYADLIKLAPTEDDVNRLRGVQAEEVQHGNAARMATSVVSPLGPQGRLDIIFKREFWHKRGGGWIGQAIYGANDGLGAVFGIVSGVAGATAGGSAVLVAGLAGMIASALSMGSGAYLASKSEREIYEAELKRERREMNDHPDEEREELELFYQLKGVPEDTAHEMAGHIFENREEALRALASEELGLSSASFPNPWVEALSATISTALGAFIPIIPFFFTSGYPAVIASFVISTLAHFLVGAAKTIVTGLNPWRSGLEMTLIGLAEAGITYALGLFFGAQVGL
jgi:VIT1/CCC1 family predicted Fe2+/Mn2+ transporter/rubrerythrin